MASSRRGGLPSWEGTNLLRKNKGLRVEALVFIGAGERSRTLDLLITNELLYQLSYTGVSAMPHKWDTAKPAILAQVFLD